MNLCIKFADRYYNSSQNALIKAVDVISLDIRSRFVASVTKLVDCIFHSAISDVEFSTFI